MTPESPSTNLKDHFESTREIIDRFEDQCDADYLYALVSGGGDSDTACQVAQDFGLELSGIVHVNTGTGIEKTRRFTMDRCLDWELPYFELTSLDDADQKRRHDGVPRQERHTECEDGTGYKLDPHPYEDLDSTYCGVRRPNDDYEKLVRKMGFPGPSMHWILYLALKHKPIKNFVKRYHDEDEEVAFVSGVRKKESDRRAKNMSEDGLSENWDGCTVVSPLSEWSDSDVSSYRREHDLPSNPVSDLLGMSGECLCGSYADREEIEQMRRWGFDDAVRFIEQLESEVFQGQVSKGYVAKEHGLWGHGNNHEPGDFGDKDDIQMMLCADCEESCDPAIMSEGDDVSKGETLIKENAHCEVWDRWFYCPDCNSILDDPITHRREVHATSPEPSYLNVISWDVREIGDGIGDGTDITSDLVTEPQMTKERRMKDIVGQSLVHPDHSCDFTPTPADGVHHCDGCGKYKIEAGEPLETMIADASEGKSIEELIELETGVVSTIIPNKHIDETKVINSADELRSVITVDDIVKLLIDDVNSLTDYLATEPSFATLITDAGINVFLDEFNLAASDVIDAEYYSNIVAALESEAEEEDEDTGTLQPEYDPDQAALESFMGT